MHPYGHFLDVLTSVPRIYVYKLWICVQAICLRLGWKRTPKAIDHIVYLGYC